MTLVQLRRTLHSLAEPAHGEVETAALLRRELSDLDPRELVTGIGGHSLAAVFTGSVGGPTVVYRADMDALPMADAQNLEYRSRNPETAHACGHDGHMAVAVGLARSLAERPPEAGRVVVLFQAAEETGEGAREVLDDPAFAPLRPDLAVAIHNLPGFELGGVITRPGPFACASRGLAARFRGATAHAAEPQHGRSPALAVAQLIQSWSAARQIYSGLSDSAQVTVIHAEVGRPAFGTSPGEGQVMATLRAPTEAMISTLETHCRRHAACLAETFELEVELEVREPFPATVNDPEITSLVQETAAELGLGLVVPEHPFPWSEDFGHFSHCARAVLIGLGAGLEQPALHHPGYDFPDRLLDPAVRLVERVVRALAVSNG